jgi:GT2 family glycosyltransferase
MYNTGIVILNYMTYKTTIECVNSILTLHSDTFKIYIIDNNSTNDSFTFLTDHYKDYNFIKIIKLTSNKGYSVGNNYGVNESINDKNRYTLISNNDVVFTVNSITNLIDSLNKNSNAIVSCPKILGSDFKYQESIKIKKLTFIDFLNFNVFRFSSRKLEKIITIREVSSFSGSCFLVDSQKFKDIGMFDENVFLFNEENILAAKIQKTSYNILYNPDSVVIHHHGLTIGKESMFKNINFLISAIYFWKTYKNKSIIYSLIIWIFYTLKFFAKSIFNKKLRNGWNNYFKLTLFPIFFK